MAIFDPSTWFGPQSPYGSPLPGAGANPYNPASAFQYDPASIRRAAISNALLSAGAAMLGAGPSRTPQNFGTSLGQGVAAGIGGAQQGAEQAMQRQQFAQQSAAGAQQYKAGQQALVGGNLANQMALLRANGVRDYFNKQNPNGPQLPPLTMEDLTNNPDLVNDPSKAAPSAAPPQLGTVNPMAPPPANAQSAGQPAPDQSATQVPAAEDPYAPQQNVIDTQMSFGNYDEGLKEQFALEQQKNAARQAAGVAAATDAVQAGGDQAYVKNSADMAATFASAEPVQQFHAALTSYGPMIAASKGTTNADQFAMVNAALKIMNPQAPTIKPGMTLSLEDAKGIPAEWYKGIQTLVGGGNLEPTEKAAILKNAQESYRALAKAYSATVNSIDKQASALPKPVPRSIWQRDLPPPNSTPPFGYVFNGKMYIGGPVNDQKSWEVVQ
jgi:hypothetical protein